MNARGEAEQAALVLVVDDYTSGREAASEYLALCGFRVEQAADGQEAIDKAQTLHPSVVLLDLSLPVRDGWEVARLLKHGERTRDIRIVALTAHALNEHVEWARGAGCDAILIKPCRPADLVAELRRQLGLAAEWKA